MIDGWDGCGWMGVSSGTSSPTQSQTKGCKMVVVVVLIHDLLFLPISTVESAVGYSLITHCCVSRLACSRLSGHIEPHSPDFKREINTTTTVMN